MKVSNKMYYSSGLEYITNDSYSSRQHQHPTYFSKSIVDNYNFNERGTTSPIPTYLGKAESTLQPYAHFEYMHNFSSHLFTPQILLSPSRPISRFVGDNDEIKNIAEETFELMMKEKLPENISINVLPFDEFKLLHFQFGPWSNGIMGFSINGTDKKIFARKIRLDELMVVIGHEIGHVLTETLPNKHDEEAKAFAFSIEWAKTIKKHNIANLGLSIKDEIDFQPARNGLHDLAFSFVDFAVKKGRKAIDLHSDLVKKYTSVFNRVY